MNNYPFFKFTAVNWLAGDISHLPFSEQGLFIYICSVYWEQDCQLTITDLKAKLSKRKHLLYDENNLTSLIEIGCIKVINDDICINFLNDQKTEINKISQIRSNAGMLGGRGVKANAKQNKAKESTCLHKDKEEDKEKDKDKELKKEKVKKETPKKILFRESEIFNIEVFAEKLRSACQGRFKNADMNYYYLNALTWSDSDNNKKVNWVATLVKWMNDDFSNNKLKTK